MSEIFEGFDWKNGELDAVQEAYLKQYAQEQIDILLRAGETDTTTAEKHLKKVYKQLGKSKPKVVWYDSPHPMLASVSDSVGDSVWASVGASVMASVRASVGASVRASVGASVRASVRASVGASVWASVGASVMASVRASVGASVRASVGDSVWASVRSWSQPWAVQYKFYNDHFETNALEDWCIYSENVSGGILTNDTAHVVRKPIRLVLGNNGRLHYDHDKAIEWADGTGFYYLHGVEFTEEQFNKIVSEEVTLTDFAKMGLSNEQRPAALQMLRADRLLKQIGAKLVNTGERGVELYQVDNFMDTDRTEYCIKMEHPTIKDKLYIEWCRPEIGKKKDADLAMASNRKLTKQQYLTAELA